MRDDSAILAAELAPGPSKADMASLLRAAGLTADVGRFSIRVRECVHLVFQAYGGDLGGPTVEASAPSVERLLRDAQLVSGALARAGVRHRFEVYDGDGVLRAYVHHDWPPGA